MCFNLLNRLTWLALVFVSMLITTALGLLTYATGAVNIGQRETLIVVGGFVAVLVIVLAYFWLRLSRTRRRTAVQSPPVQPWFDVQPNVPYAYHPLIHEPPVSAEATPSHPLAPVIIRASATITPTDLIDTRPMHPVQMPPRKTDVVLEDTKPMKAVQPSVTQAGKPLPPGPYDNLFPPAQPGDEDYLETSHMEAILPQAETRSEGLPPSEAGQQTVDDSEQDTSTGTD